MQRSTRRLLIFLLSLPPTVLFFALVYQAGMRWLEGKPRGFWRSMMTVVETLTTTGYGADSSWDHPAMALLMILLQFLGVLVIFLIFPVYLLPFMEERFERRLPTKATGLVDHLVIFRSGPAVSTLLDELEEARIPYVVIDEDEEAARRMFDEGRKVIHRPLGDEALAAAGLLRARAVVANGDDDANGALILAARQMGYDGEIVALVEEATHRKPLLLAGATAVFDPRHMLGASLAARASRRIDPVIAGVQQVGERLSLCEIRVESDSPLAGHTLAEARIGQRTKATVIGQWVGGNLMRHPSAGMRIEPHGLLVAVGAREAVERLAKLAGPSRPMMRTGPIVVAGCGEVGGKVVQLLRDAGEDVRAIDREEKEGVDLVGNVLDPDLLKEAGADQAQTVVLALDTDSATLFATVIMKDIAPRVPVVARVNSGQNLKKIHRAGADYALSVSEVAGQMLAQRLLGREVVAVDQHLKVLKVCSAGLVGKRLGELDIRGRTGCSVVAVERGDEALAGSDAESRFEEGDIVFICGSGEAIRRYLEVFPQPQP